MNHWLIKSEGYLIDDLKRDKKTAWTGVRNYQARNFMRDGMKVGDLAFFYHSSTKVTGIYGVAKVVSKPHEDETSLDPKSHYFDPRAVKAKKEGKPPMWMCVDFAYVEKFAEPISLREIKSDPILKNMPVARQGMRLSVQPVSDIQFERVMKIAK